MSNYTKTTDFAIKDGLASGNPSKIIKGTEHDTEYNNIATAVASKADLAGPALTGVPTVPTAAAGTNTTQAASTEFVQTAIIKDKARYHASSGQSLTALVSTKITLSVSDFDTNSIVSSSRFTPKKAGYYKITAACSVNMSGNGETFTSLFKNGVEISRGSRNGNATTSTVAASVVADLMFFNGTTDYVELFMYTSVSGTTEFNAATYMTMIGPL